jgi:ubiquitin-hydrolase Zn-finger-containing protein
MATCTHLDTLNPVTPSDDGCHECLAAGGRWVHLRMCQQCGHVGCCDSSPMKHASAHAREVDHPIMRSLEPGEDWSWCFVDEVAMRIPQVQGETRIPPSPLG